MNRFSVAFGLVFLSVIGTAWAHDEPTFADGGTAVRAEAARVGAGEVDFGVVSDGAADGASLGLVGRGERRLPGGTTDVWVQDGYAYLGTFAKPCGNGEVGDAGVHVYDVRDPANITEVGALPSQVGSRVNDVKVARLAGGTRLVHSNETCGAGGRGGFELYDVADPLRPVHLAHVQTDTVNEHLRQNPRHRNLGVHNLFLFSNGGRDYAAAQVYTTVGTFQIFDITDPDKVTRVSHFGPEAVKWADVDWAKTTDEDLLSAAETYLRSGYGASTNRFLHDMYVTPDGRTAYLANWDAGLIRLDLTNVAQPKLVSVALDPTSEDGEVNSHSVWASEDGRTVLEGEEDFNPYRSEFFITSGEKAGSYASTEGTLTKPLATLPGKTLSGSTVYVGDACGDVPAPRESGQLALVQRGNCTFNFKAVAVRQAGYAGLVVFNDAQSGDELVSMGGGKVAIPGLFVGHATGLALAGVESEAALEPGKVGASVRATITPDGWSGLRVWDYSDPEAPVLAATFNTLCSAHPDDESCDPNGIYSSHNLIVEDGKAYVSWYADGVLVLDLSDPYRPVEVARYHEAGADFEARNGGPQDVWGIYKVPGEPLLYASDRNGGLYVLDTRLEPGEADDGR